MSSSTTSVENQTTNSSEETPSANNPQPQPRRSVRKVLFGLVALLLLGGLASLAFLTTTASPASTSLQTTATPAATGTPNATATTSSAQNPALDWRDGARPVLNDMVVVPGQYQLLYAGLSNGLRRSNDGGKTWTEIEQFKDKNITALAIDQDDGEKPVYAATDLGGLFKTTDDGKTWKNLGLVGRPINALAAARRTIYVSVTGPRPSIYRSPDGGLNWAAPNPNALPDNLEVHSLAVDLLNPQTVYIGTGYAKSDRFADWGRVKVSIDGAKTWRDAGNWSAEKGDGPDPYRPVSVLLYTLPDRLYAGDGENLWRLSADHTTWQPVVEGLPTGGIYALTTDPQLAGLVYAATRDGFYRNSDGLTWQKVATGESSALFSDENLQRNLAVVPAFVATTTSAAANSVNGLRSTYLYALNSDGRITRYDNRDFGAELVATIPGADNIPDFSALGGLNPADAQEPPAAGTNDPESRYFTETRHYLRGEFKAVWESRDRNGLLLYGFPLTEQFQEFDPAQKITKTVQFFERVKFEQVRAGSPVALGLIGYEAIEGRYFPPGRFITTNSTQQYFPETKHTLKGEFFKFWSANGGLLRFGYPITEEFTEKTPEGKEIVYQYFQRTRFAFDPSAPANQRVTISLLGREVLQKRNWLQ